MHPRSMDYSLVDHGENCLVRAISGTLHFDAIETHIDGEDEEEDEYDPYTESLAEQEKEVEEDEELIDDILAKYDHLPPAQKERLKKLAARERDEDEEDKYLVSHVDYAREHR